MIFLDDVATPTVAPPVVSTSVPFAPLDSKGFNLHEFVTNTATTAPNLGIVVFSGFCLVAAVFTIAFIVIWQSGMKAPFRKFSWTLLVGLFFALVLLGAGVALGNSVHWTEPSATKPSASTSGFAKWADTRYGVTLSESAVASLVAGNTTAVPLLGTRSEIHANFDSNKLYLFQASGAELPLASVANEPTAGG
jgi:hypothetical protein